MNKSLGLWALFCVSFISQTLFSQSYPSLGRNVTPGVSAPGDGFSPSFSGSASSEAPQAAEWTRTAGPDESLILTGYQLSRFSGQEEGKDTRFLIYGSGGVTKQARIQRLDGEKAVITLDGSLPSWSMYLVWPGNDAGWGAPMAINKTDAWWVGPDKAQRGGTVSVFGRNLAHGNVEGSSNSHVYLKSISGSSSQWASVVKVNPYRVDFTIPSSLSNGEYEVWVHNGHGGEWGWSSPLKLQVWDGPSWSGHTINVRDYGAKGDGYSDDAGPVKRAIEAAKNNPGSTIFFPAGTYMFSTLLDAHSNTRWQGEGKDKTILKCSPNFSSPYAFIFGEPQNFELNDMTIDANKSFHGGTGQPVFLRESEDVHINNVKFNCQNYEPIDVHNTKRVFVTNCEFIGRAFFVGSANQLFIDHSSFKMTNDADMAIYSWGANGLSITNSTCQDLNNANPSDLSGWGKGRFLTGAGNWGSNRNTYLAFNTTNDLSPSRYSPDQNSGEQLMWEGNTPSWKGNISSATANTVTLNGYNINEPNKNYLVVIKGKGLGQSRRVVANNGGTVTLDEPWNVIPDGSSVLTVGPFVDRVAVYKNYLDAKAAAATQAEHVAAAGIEPYGGALNFIADNNTLHELRYGTATWSQQWADDQPWSPNYFTMYSNNKYINCRVAIQNNADARSPYGAAIFGTMYRKNIIQNTVKAAIENVVKYKDYPLFSTMVYEHNSSSGTQEAFFLFAYSTYQHEQVLAAGGMDNQLLYKNNFGGAGSAIMGSSKMGLRENSYSGFASKYSGILPDAVIEAPLHVIELNASVNGAPIKTSFELWNSGTSPLGWKISSSAAWLTISSTTGSIASEKENSFVELIANPQGLSGGLRKGYITFTAGSQTKIYTVLLNIGASVQPITPTVQLTSPSNGSNFTAPASITLTADATDADGTITKVEFFNGATKLGEDASAPYTLEWTGMQEGHYSLTAKATDNSGMSAMSQVITTTIGQNAAPVSSTCSGTGSITWEYVNDVSWGTSLSSIATAQASGSRQLTSFAAPQNFAEYFGSRTKGYICPPASGQYTFYIAADDLAELWLSTDANAANKQKIASVNSWTNPGQYDQNASQKSVSITLNAGQRYYIEVLHLEFNGGDNLSVAWKLPDGTMQAPIAGAHLMPLTAQPTPAPIVQNAAPVSSTCSGTGSITWEYVNDVSWGTSLSSIATAQASGSRQLTSFAAPQNFAEYFGSRTKGYICPPASGQYTFYIAADDLAELWLSTDANAANKQKIASVNSWTNPGQYDQNASQKSVSITLTAGQRYYIEVLHLEFNGGDNLSVAWKLPDGTMQAPIAGAHLMPLTAQPTPAPIVQNAAPVSSTCSGTGSITWEYVNDVSWGTSLSSIATAQASGSRQLTSFAAPQNFAEYFGSRTKGYICPPASGQYTFYIAADDLAELWLSTDANAANKQKIASVNSWTNPGQYDQNASQKSVSITLTAGQRYYIEVLHLEFNGGDNLSVAWKLPDGTMQAPIAGAHLMPLTAQPTPAPIVQNAAPVSSTCSGTGSITWEYVNDVSWGTSLSSIATAQASGSRQLTSFAAPQNFAEYFGSRTKGYICPPASGQYTFYIAADDLAELWLSTDANAANKQKIASVNSWTNPGQYDQNASQKSVSITLTAGQRYYIEVLHLEFNGGDNLSVAWKLPDGTMQAPIAGAHLMPYIPVAKASRFSTDLDMQHTQASAIVIPATDHLRIYPNPFREQATIEFSISGKCQCEPADIQSTGRIGENNL